MKIFVKIIKIGLVFIFSTVVIYLTMAIGKFISVCHVYQIPLPLTFSEEARENYILNLNPEKLEELGQNVSIFEGVMKQAKEVSLYSEEELQNHTLTDGHEHTFADFYDPTGFALWGFLDGLVQYIGGKYVINAALFLGISVTIAYAVITSKKMNLALKIVIGYFGMMLAFPPLYMYSWTYRFWKLYEMYWNQDSKRFYAIYTTIFVLIFVINYVIGRKMTRQLNETIRNNENI